MHRDTQFSSTSVPEKMWAWGEFVLSFGQTELRSLQDNRWKRPEGDRNRLGTPERQIWGVHTWEEKLDGPDDVLLLETWMFHKAWIYESALRNREGGAQI